MDFNIGHVNTREKREDECWSSVMGDELFYNSQVIKILALLVAGKLSTFSDTPEFKCRKKVIFYTAFKRKVDFIVSIKAVLDSYEEILKRLVVNHAVHAELLKVTVAVRFVSEHIFINIPSNSMMTKDK